MYGLGIYLADLSNKSHRYCSQPKIVNGCKRYHMVLCSVVGRAWKLQGHLTRGDAMHDLPTNRMLRADEAEEMIEPCCLPGSSSLCSGAASGVGASIRGTAGALWGRCVADEGSCWRLASGRIAKKETEGIRWYWSQEGELSAQAVETQAEKSNLLHVKGLGDR